MRQQKQKYRKSVFSDLRNLNTKQAKMERKNNSIHMTESPKDKEGL